MKKPLSKTIRKIEKALTFNKDEAARIRRDKQLGVFKVNYDYTGL